MKRNIGCPCGRTFSIETEEEVDLDQNIEYLDKILSGTFMSFSCPACSKKHKPEYKVMLVWKSKKLKLEVLPELERGEFYRRRPDKVPYETIIGYPEMADRVAVIKDNLEPMAIETLKYYLLAKAEENYPDRDVNAWYHAKGPDGIEFHLDGIREDEVAVMRVPQQVYEKTCEDYRKHPKNEIFASMRCRSYLSVQNMFRPDILK
jgi:hypothetical protein